VEPSVSGIPKLLLTGRAERKIAQGGTGAVVGHLPHNAIAGSAVGAVEKGMAKAAVGRVPQFLQTLGAGGEIRKQQGANGSDFSAGMDGEVFISVQRKFAGPDFLQTGKRRSLFGKPAKEGLQRWAGTLHLDVDSLRVIAYPAGKFQVPGQAVDMGPEPHALHDALHADL
jgi:hypothetical protein